jgi:hypothetical protein
MVPININTGLLMNYPAAPIGGIAASIEQAMGSPVEIKPLSAYGGLVRRRWIKCGMKKVG